LPYPSPKQQNERKNMKSKTAKIPKTHFMARTPAQLSALAAARSRRASNAARTVPDGYRSVEHFLDEVREYVGRWQLTNELARYLRVNEASVRRWVKREKIPLQPTLDAMATWMRTKKAGL
jgi:DNA-binding transcriptional regulator YiaG